MTPKKPRSIGRLSQLSKRSRLTRRSLGQWTAQPNVARVDSESRYELEENLWREKP